MQIKKQLSASFKASNLKNDSVMQGYDSTFRGVFKAQSNIYDEAFLRKQLTAESC